MHIGGRIVRPGWRGNGEKCIPHVLCSDVIGDRVV